MNHLAEMYMQGYSLENTGKYFGVSRHVVKRAVIKEGLPIRTRVEARNLIKPIPDEWYEMDRLQKRGMTYEKLASKFYCSESSVTYRLMQVRKRGAK